MIAWPAAQGGCGKAVRIGMVDTGVNAGHAALKDAKVHVHRIKSDARFSASDAVHGTAVAALLVGRADSRSPGLVPEAELIAVDAFHKARQDERADAFALVEALDYLASQDVQIVNLSLAGPPNQALGGQIRRMDQQGIVLVAAAGNGGAAPPDLSVMAKARHDGANYIYSLLSGYRAPPAGLQIREGQHYNPYMAGDLTPFWTGDHDHVPPGGFIAMPPPLQDGQVTYDDGAPQTVDQYSKDVAAFIAWSSEPKMVERKQAGFGVMIFLLIFAGLTYVSYRRIWKGVAH